MMSDLDPPFQSQKQMQETAKGRPLGFLLNRTHTPLLTTVTKPQNVMPQISPVFSYPGRERQSTLANQELFKFPVCDKQNTEHGLTVKNVQHAKSQSHLLTTVTLDENIVRLSNGSNLDQPALSSNIGEQQEEIHKPHAAHLDYGGTSKQHVSCDERMTSFSQAHHDPVSIYLDSLEQQIVQQEINKDLHQSKPVTSLRKGHSMSSSDSFRKGHGQFSPKCESSKRNSIPTPRSHTDSICSNCSAEDSVNGQSRCSVCDGSSVTSAGRLHTGGNDSGFLDHTDSVIDNDAKIHFQSFGSQEYLNEEELTRYIFKDEDFDSSSCKCSFYASHTLSSGNHSRNNSGGEDRKSSKSVCLTREQLVFLLQRVELSKYRMFMEERLADLGSMTKSQQKTIVCLIQAVVIIKKRLQSETDQRIQTQAEIKQLQSERTVYSRQQTRVRLCMCAILCLYLLNINAVRERLVSIIRYFGIVETVKKVNRTRKMIAENWRNIPSLLTNFWRIFIFRTNA